MDREIRIDDKALFGVESSVTFRAPLLPGTYEIRLRSWYSNGYYAKLVRAHLT